MEPETDTNPATLTLPPLAFLALAACDAAPDDPPETEDASSAKTEASLASRPAPSPDAEVIEIDMHRLSAADRSDAEGFVPQLVSAEVGDVLRFVPSSDGHVAASIETMLPEGASGWEGEAGESVSYVIPQPGIYGFQCVEHYAAGMVGIVIVEGEGMTDNLEAARSAGHPGLGNPAFFELFEKAEERGLLD